MHLYHFMFYIFVCGSTQAMGRLRFTKRLRDREMRELNSFRSAGTHGVFPDLLKEGSTKAMGMDHIGKVKIRIDDDDEDYTSDGSGHGGDIYTLDDNSKKTILFTNISVEKGSDLVLTCAPQSPLKKAKWVNEHVSCEHTARNGTIKKTLFNLTRSCRLECQKSDNIVERFVINVHVPEARILNKSHNIVKNGTILHLPCVVNSINPPDTACLRVISTYTSHKHFTKWESRKRICMGNDYNRTDCAIETTFQYNVKVTESGDYICSYERAESKSLFVEVLIEEPIVYKATEDCADKAVQQKIVTFAIEALVNYGLNTNTTTHIRQKCNDEFGTQSWNCIIGRHITEFSLSPDIFDDTRSSFRFSLGSIFISVFQTNK